MNRRCLLRTAAAAPLLTGGSLLATTCGSAGTGNSAVHGSNMLSTAPIPVVPAQGPPPKPLPPVQLPRDEAPHDALAEWWYYTGHLFDANGNEYGFELVFFRGVRGSRPPGYAAHFAITDRSRGIFRYAQKQDVALNELANGSPAPLALASTPPLGIVSLPQPQGGFDLRLDGWSLAGLNGRDHLDATMPGYTLDLSLQATKPPALHLGAPPLQPGLISFGPAGTSYYYSRTHMEAQGTLLVDGVPHAVHGLTWMDHQWGDFLVLGGGGWDWFAGNLNDGRDMTFSVIRNEQGQTVIAYGTLVGADGVSRHLPPGSFSVVPVGAWTSPHTGITYPSGWRIQIPTANLDLLWLPILPDQELNTQNSTGVIYWEGAVALLDPQTRADLGRGYVELTGYGAPPR